MGLAIPLIVAAAFTVSAAPALDGAVGKRSEAAEKYNQAARELQEGRASRAESLLGEALALDPDFAEVYNLRGAIRLQEGQYGEAESDFAESVRLKPGYAVAYNNLGVALSKKNSARRAIEAFKKAAQLDPRDDRPFYNLGLMLAAGGHIQTAARYFLHALRANPKNTDALWKLAETYRKAGMKTEAEAAYVRLVRTTEQDPAAVSALAELYESQGMLASAARVIDEAVQAGRSSARIRLERAQLLLLAGRYDVADGEFRALIEEHPDLAGAYSGAASAILGRKDGGTREALKLAEKGVQLSGEKDSRALYALGLAREASDDVAGAQMAYLMAAKLDPNFVEAQVNLGVIAAQARRYGQAAEHFRKAAALDPGNFDAKYNLARVLIAGKLDYKMGVNLLGELALQATSGNHAANEAAKLLKTLAGEDRRLGK